MTEIRNTTSFQAPVATAENMRITPERKIVSIEDYRPEVKPEQLQEAGADILSFAKKEVSVRGTIEELAENGLANIGRKEKPIHHEQKENELEDRKFEGVLFETNKEEVHEEQGNKPEKHETAELKEKSSDKDDLIDIHNKEVPVEARIGYLESQINAQQAQIKELETELEDTKVESEQLATLNLELAKLMLEFLQEKDEKKKEDIAENILKLMTHLVGIFIMSLADPDRAANQMDEKVKQMGSTNKEDETQDPKEVQLQKVKEMLMKRLTSKTEQAQAA